MASAARLAIPQGWSGRLQYSRISASVGLPASATTLSLSSASASLLATQGSPLRQHQWCLAAASGSGAAMGAAAASAMAAAARLNLPHGLASRLQ